jgi:hypothetical protein
MDNRSRFSIKIDALQRLLMINALSGSLPLYIVTEYPKSGGTWFSQMLSTYLRVPFPRNQRPRINRCVMHGHYLYSPFMKNVICVVRDGRDVVVSAYYHMLFYNEKNTPHLVDKTRKLNVFSDYDDITSNLPAFIEYLFAVENKKLFHFNWGQFLESWLDKPDAILVKYEDLLEDAAVVLQPVLEKLTGEEVDMQRLVEIRERFSFKAQSKREPGQEDSGSFLRKGIAGDWKNKFDRAACEAFDYYAGDPLIQAGYEKDRRWLTECSVSN